jgi:hypothetical protein
VRDDDATVDAVWAFRTEPKNDRVIELDIMVILLE